MNDLELWDFSNTSSPDIHDEADVSTQPLDAAAYDHLMDALRLSEGLEYDWMAVERDDGVVYISLESLDGTRSGAIHPCEFGGGVGGRLLHSGDGLPPGRDSGSGRYGAGQGAA